MEINLDIKNKIFAAANELVLEGVVSPTNQQVRTKMGGGSLSHISPVMRDWRDLKQNENVSVIDMPGELRLAIENSLSHVWAVANKMANAEMDLIKETVSKELNEVIVERDEAFVEISNLEQKLNTSNTDLSIATQMLQKKTEECESLKESNFNINTEAMSIKAQISIHKAESERMKNLLEESQEAVKELQKELILIAKSRGNVE